MAGPRPIWKGALSISLVTLPIKVFPATEESPSISLHQLHECGGGVHTRISQPCTCRRCQREVPPSEIVKGYEFETDRYVVFAREEWDALKPESSKVIDLVRFADASALPWRAIDKTYYLAPDGAEAEAAYAILVEGWAGRVGLGRWTNGGRESLVGVSPQAGALLLYALHPVSEWREVPYTAPDPRAVKGSFRLPAEEVTLVQRVTAAFSGPLDLADFTDQVQVNRLRLINAKIAGEEIVQQTPIALPSVVNLKTALEQSLRAVRAVTRTAKAATLREKRPHA